MCVVWYGGGLIETHLIGAMLRLEVVAKVGYIYRHNNGYEHFLLNNIYRKLLARHEYNPSNPLCIHWFINIPYYQNLSLIFPSPPYLGQARYGQELNIKWVVKSNMRSDLSDFRVDLCKRTSDNVQQPKEMVLALISIQIQPTVLPLPFASNLGDGGPRVSAPWPGPASRPFTLS